MEDFNYSLPNNKGAKQLSELPRYKEADLRKGLERQIDKLIGRKDSKDKAPIYTFCLQFKNAIEQLALRSKYGHEKYPEEDKDWMNFSRMENPDYEYGNAQFRHALGIGDDEDELQHRIADAWNSIAKLECYLQSKKVSK